MYQSQHLQCNSHSSQFSALWHGRQHQIITGNRTKPQNKTKAPISYKKLPIAAEKDGLAASSLVMIPHKTHMQKTLQGVAKKPEPQRSGGALPKSGHQHKNRNRHECHIPYHVNKQKGSRVAGLWSWRIVVVDVIFVFDQDSVFVGVGGCGVSGER